jgi:hypothetical protein
MKVPSKFTACYLLAFAVAAGAGIDGLKRRIGHTSRWRVALAPLVMMMALDLLWVSRPIFAYAFPVEPIATDASAFHQVRRSPYKGRLRIQGEHQRQLPVRPSLPVHSLSSDFAGVRSNIGTLATYTGVFPRVNARPDAGNSLGLEQHPPSSREPPRLSYWSPNELRIEVDPGRGGELVVNHNFGPAWSATGDGRSLTVKSHAGRLSALLEPGVREVVFRYRSPPARFGATVSAVSLAVLVLGVLWLALRRRPEGDAPPQ